MNHRIPTERSFGKSVGTAFLLFGGLSWWRGHPTLSVVLAVLGATLVLGALLAPSLLRVPNRLWWKMAMALGWVNARIILSVFFFIVLTPAGLIMRALGRNPFAASGAGTNWSAYLERRRNRTHYEHAF
jgi:hypothetical protein